MRTDSILFFASLFVSSFLIIISKPNSSNHYYTEKAIGKINIVFQNDLNAFVEASKQFDHTISLYSNDFITKGEVDKEYKNLRVAFKKVEYVIEYLDKEAADKMLNGAPLPKLEAKVADLVILEPKGLQVIDELMASDNFQMKLEELRSTSEKFKKDVAHIQTYLESKAISDRQFFEAARQAIIRMATLGITGFDTPGTNLGIHDTQVVLKALKNNSSLYNNELVNIQKRELGVDINNLLQTGILATDSSDFATFNRLGFISDVLNPLYKKLLEMHMALGYETISEITKYEPAVNYYSDNIFAPDFLNNFYYASISNDTNFNVISNLGKQLFYDPILSSDNTMACASCHQPEKAFTDGMPTSMSNKGIPLKRNAMTLNYTAFASGFFHDMRTKRLEDQFEHVVVSDDEFNTNYQEVLSKLLESQTYRIAFKEAFPDQKQNIVANNIDYALVAYVMSLNAFNSPVDQYFQGKIKTLPEEVVRGFNLFTGKAACATCHFLPLYSGTVPPLYIESESEVLGIPENKDTPQVLDDDLGRLGNGRTQEVAHFMKNAFKTPTIRNISKTGPYMHNGIYSSLEEVMEFYNEGGGAGRGINLKNQTLSSEPLDLSDKEISDLIAFMNALEDTSVFSAPKTIPRDFKSKKLNNRKLVK